MAEPLNAPFPRPDSRDLDLQGQVDDLRVALRDWRRTREYSEATQKRLEQLTLQCAHLMETWQQMQPRGASTALTGRVAPSTGEKIRALERAIENEWEAVPTGTDDPSRQLSEQTASLVESCVAATHLALRGYENAENRVAALEREIQTGLSQVSRDLQQVLAEIRSTRAPAAPAAPFPLEGVMRIHQELRQELRQELGEAAEPAALPEAPPPRIADVPPVSVLPHVQEQPSEPAPRRERSERRIERRREPPPVTRRSWWPSALATVIVALAIFAGLGWLLQRRIDNRLAEAATQVAEAEKQRDALVAETRQETARQVADAQRTAAQAQIVGAVMAAPDLVRYWLTGLGESRAYAHVLVSRSRGLVFSASRLDPPPPGRTHQLWLVTAAGIVNGGILTPDAQGRVTLANEAPVILPGRLTGAMVTLEAAGGSAVPSADRVLIQVE